MQTGPRVTASAPASVTDAERADALASSRDFAPAGR